MKTLYIDVETTGLDPARHEIVQLAYILDVGGDTVVERSLLMRPLKTDFEDKALEVQGRTREEIQLYQHPFAAYTQFIRDLDAHISKYDTTDKAVPVAYNAAFDLDFLKAWFLSNGNKFLGSYINWRTLDPLALVRWLEAAGALPPLADHKLQTVLNAYAIPLAKAHDALADIQATRRLTRVLLDVLAHRTKEK